MKRIIVARFEAPRFTVRGYGLTREEARRDAERKAAKYHLDLSESVLTWSETEA